MDIDATNSTDNGPDESGRRADESSRRQFLRRSVTAGTAVSAVALGAAGFAAPTQATAAATSTTANTATAPTGAAPGTGTLGSGVSPDTPSTFFSTVSVEEAGTVAAKGSDGDLWANCWADDGATYSANGDGRGFSEEPFKDLVMNRIDGTPTAGLTGVKLAESNEIANVWADPAQYNRKPTGMVCVGGVLYVAVQDLKYGDNAFDDAPNASISRSDDHGRTWRKTSKAMFTDHRFTTIFFLDFGKDSRYAVRALGPRDGAYVYAYGLDWNWRASNTNTVPDPVDVYLARVPASAVQDRSKWEFFTGMKSVGGRAGTPTWSPRIGDKVAVLHDTTRRFTHPVPGKTGDLTVISQGGVLYNAALKRYLYTSWTDPTFEFYESPTPWGPWKRFLVHNFGLVEWFEMNDPKHTPKNGGYGTTIPSKFVSADGREMWVQSNWWKAPVPTPEANYNFNLRRLKVTPYRRTTPTNRPNPRDNLARTGANVTPLAVSTRFGNRNYCNDGNKTLSEDSFDGQIKKIDYWGYTFSRTYHLNRVVYTAGAAADEGGWFARSAGGLRVQVRQEFRWVDVRGLRITPDYPYDVSAAKKTYTMTFDRTWGDGIRIVGVPAGKSTYTSLAELEVYYQS